MAPAGFIWGFSIFKNDAILTIRIWIIGVKGVRFPTKSGLCALDSCRGEVAGGEWVLPVAIG